MKNDAVKTGMQWAPHRFLSNALDMTEEEMKEPLVGTVSSYNEMILGHTNLGKIVDTVKLGIAMAGGTPVVFPVTVVCDGIVMGHIGMEYSLMTRNLTVDPMECMALAHQFDVLIIVPNYDKNVPGLLTVAARISVLTVFINSGPMLAGHVEGYKTSLSSMSGAVGAYAAGNISGEDVKESENKACPTCSSCSGMYTANNMNCLTGVLGMGLRGNSTTSTAYSKRIKLAKYIGMEMMEMCEKNTRPRDIMTKEALTNALATGMALGYPTNSMLRLLTIVHEAGVELNVDVANEVSARTPNLYRLAPAGPTYIEDLNEAEGIYAVIKEISKKGLLNLNCMTVMGRTVGKNIKDCVNKSPEVIRPVENPCSQTGGIAILKGNLVPDSAVVRRSAVAPKILRHEGPARTFDCEEDAIDAIKGGRIVAGDMAVICYEGPKGGPGMREMLNPTSAIVGMGSGSTVALITDGRFSGASRGVSISHASPEAAMGGFIALVGEGDIISIDIDNHKLNVLVPDEEMTARKAR